MAEGGRLNATTWFDRTNYFETVPTGARRAGPVARGRPARAPPRRRDAGEPRQPARRRQGGEAAALRQPALRQRPHRRLRRGVPRGPPLPPPDDRVDGGPRRREPRGRPRVLPPLLRARQHGAHAVRRHHAGGRVRARWSDTSATCRPSAEPPRRDHAQLDPLAEPVRVDRREVVPNDRLHVAFRLPVDETDEFLACGGGARLHRWPRHLAPRPAAGPARADRARRRTPPHGASSTARPWASSCSTSRRAPTPTTVEAAFVEELEGFLADGPTEVELEASLAQSERSWLSALASQEERADLISHTPAARRPRGRQHPPRPAAGGRPRPGAGGAAAGCSRPEPSCRLPRRRTQDGGEQEHAGDR